MSAHSAIDRFEIGSRLTALVVVVLLGALAGCAPPASLQSPAPASSPTALAGPEPEPAPGAYQWRVTTLAAKDVVLASRRGKWYSEAGWWCEVTASSAAGLTVACDDESRGLYYGVLAQELVREPVVR